MLFIILFSSALQMALALPSAQTSSDSLMKIISATEGIKKVDALNKAAEYIQKYSAKEALPLAVKALDLAAKLNYRHGKAEAQQNMAAIESKNGNNKAAVILAQHARVLFDQVHEHEAAFNSLLKQASIYQALDNDDKAIEKLLQALHQAEDQGRVDLQSIAVSTMSQFFTKINDKSNGLSYASKALWLSRAGNNTLSSAHAYQAMGMYLSKFGPVQSAGKYFRIALKYFIAYKQLSTIAGCNVQFGNHYLSIGALDSAQACYFTALKLVIRENDILKQSSIYSLIAHAYQLDHNLNKALAFQKKALKLRQQFGNVSLTGSSLSNIGTVYSNMGNYPKALEFFDAGLKLAKQTGRMDYIKYNYQHIYELYSKSKNYKKALEYNLLLSAVNDTILKNESRKKFVSINYKHVVGQKQQALDFLSKENEIQKLRLMQTRFTSYVLAAAILFFLIIALLLIIQANLTARHRQMDIEQKLLRSQMNPHFIFNALVAIQSFIYKNEAGEAGKYLSSFARLIRLVLSNSHQEFVTLKCEIDTLSNYLSLQKLRFENKFDYTLVVDPRLDAELINIPPMLAQPFVENAIEHGIFGMKTPGRIVIIIDKKDNTILLEVKDNGIGRKKGRELRMQSDKSHVSLATRITEERIRSLNRKYSWKITLNITDLFNAENEPSGTSVLLSLPMLSVELN